MIGKTILRPGGAIRGIPIKEDNHARCRLDAVVGPLATVFEPLDAVHTTCEFWNDAVFDIAALVGTPAHKASTPFHTALKAVP